VGKSAKVQKSKRVKDIDKEGGRVGEAAAKWRIEYRMSSE
jgi:hypothetical protein